jgi:MFS family permease
VSAQPKVSLHASRFASLRQRNFSLFLIARFLATVAIQMQSVAVGWQVYALTGDPFDLGLVGLVQFAPFVPMALVAGHVADVYDRRRIIALCYAVEMLCGLSLLAFSWTGLVSLWPVFAVMTLYGTARAFMMPASQAVVVNLVPVDLLQQALALNSSAFQIAIISGPALGGLIYLAGPSAVYATVAAMLAVASILLACTDPTSRRTPLNNNPICWTTVLQGLHYVRSQRIILGAMSLDLFAVLFGGATALLPAYASDILQVGPTGLGLLKTAPGIGAACTAFFLAFRPIHLRVGYWMFGGVLLFGVGSLLLGGSDNFVLSLLALTLMGMGDMVSVYIRHLLVQTGTPDAIRGRVSAVNAVFIGASNELGEFESGLAAAWLGLIPAVLAGGCATLAIAVAWMLAFPELRTLDRFPERVVGPAAEKPSGRQPRYTRRRRPA